MLVLGHRGAIHGEGGVSQNSMEAFREALAEGDGFETDAVLDKEGEIFLIHEAKYVDPAKGVDYCMGKYLDPVSAARLGHRRIDQLSTSEVQQLRLKDGQGIPRLRDALTLVGVAKNKLLNIELKGFGVAGPVLDLVGKAITDGIITADNILLSSFNHGALREVRQRMPQIKTGAIFVAADQQTTPLFPWRPDSDAAYTALTSKALENSILRDVQPDYFVMPQEVLTQETAAIIASVYPNAQLAAWVFTEKGNLDLPDLLARLASPSMKNRVAALIVDHPAHFRKALAELR